MLESSRLKRERERECERERVRERRATERERHTYIQTDKNIKGTRKEIAREKTDKDKDKDNIPVEHAYGHTVSVCVWTVNTLSR